MYEWLSLKKVQEMPPDGGLGGVPQPKLPPKMGDRGG